MANSIQITSCDNELQIIAFNGASSYKLCDIQSGNNYGVNITLNINGGIYLGSVNLNGVNNALNQTVSVTIPVGSYQVIALGINWGGPSAFSVSLNGTNFTPAFVPTQNTGLVWQAMQPMNIAATIRKNQKNMTAADWQNYIQAINSFMADTSGTNYAAFVNCHVQAMTTHHEWGAHGGINFLTWHRDYMLHFEAKLISFNPNAFVPYWNWVVDRAIPPAINVQSDLTRWNVTRNANPDFSQLANAAQLQALMGQTTFANFTSMIENAPFHNTLHNIIGGNMATAASPSDPIFWLHHAFMDKIFADWQALNPTIVHPSMSTQLLPPPFLTETNAQVWNMAAMPYQYA